MKFCYTCIVFFYRFQIDQNSLSDVAVCQSFCSIVSDTRWVKCGCLVMLQRCIEHTLGQMRLFVNHFAALYPTHIGSNAAVC